MQGILYEEHSALLFILVTVVMGGWAAWQTGQAVAKTWGEIWKLVAYCLLLGLVVRFLHFALFQGTLLSLKYYIVDTAIVTAAGLIGWRVKRATQMVTQYPWEYVRSGPLGWRRRMP
jgi:hypothetical protein